MNNILDVALAYIRRGWNPVPIPFKKKKPVDRDWQNRVIGEPTAPRYFNGGMQNVGVQLGPTSHGLTDLDLDCAEAVALAPYILPPTRAIFGRATKPASHWLYTTDLSIECQAAAIQFKAPDGAMLLELRIGGGGKGAQTVFPGSTHESGESVSWEMNKDGEPAEVDGEQLTRCAKTLAAATLLARTWPAEGGRHKAALVVGGVLARAGMGDRSAAYVVRAIARAAGDCEWCDRAQAAQDAVKNSKGGGRTAGFPQLAEIVGRPAAQKIAEWLGYRHPQQPEQHKHDGPAWKISSPPDGGVTLDHFYSYMPMHRYIFTPTHELWPQASVNGRMPSIPLFDRNGLPVLNKKGDQIEQPASKWLDKNKPVEQMTWAPGLPMIVENRFVCEGGWIEHDGARCFNLYRPAIIVPGQSSGAARWLNHVHKIYPEDADHIKKWLAHRVRRPQEKINHALALIGGQGIGKDTILEPVKMAIGPWNFSEVSPQQILGRFNGFVKSVILRVSEARDVGGYDRFAFYEHMKTYTAAPPDVLRVDEKNLREYSVFNCTSVIITTNNRIDGLYLPADDRRHYVAASSCKKEDFDDEYWRSLWGWYVSGGDGDVAAYLSHLDISSFNPKAPPPKTAAFWSIVNASRAPEDAELADVLDRIGNPAAVTLSQIQAAAFGEGDFGLWLQDRKNRRAIPHRMENCGYVAVHNTDCQAREHQMSRKTNPTLVADVAHRRPPVRVRTRKITASSARHYPPDGEGRIWWGRLKKALGTASSDFVNASLLQIEAAAQLHCGGISEVAINAALAMIEAAASQNEIEGALAVQMACTHTAAISVLARFGGGAGSERRVAALASAAARLLRAYSGHVETLRRLRHGGDQYVRVEHVHVNEGGQAVIGNVRTRDERAEQSPEKQVTRGDHDEEGTLASALDLKSTQ